MTSTTFVDYSTPAVNAAWLNDVNFITYNQFVCANRYISTTNTAAQNVAGWAALKAYVDGLSTGAHVQVSRGTYLFNASIARSRNMVLAGEGRTTTVFSFSHTGDGITSTEAINSSTAVNFALRDIALTCTNGSNTGGGFVDVGGTFINLDSVYIDGFKYGTIFDQTEIATIDKCTYNPWRANGGGIWLVNGADHTASASQYYTNRIRITNNQFNMTTGATAGSCIIDDGGSNHYIDGNNFNGGYKQLRACAVFGLTFTNNECEVAGDFSPIQFFSTSNAGTAITPCGGFTISGNVIGSSGQGVFFWAANNGVVEGNAFYGHTTAAVDYDNAHPERISGISIQSNEKVIVGNGKTAYPFFAPGRLQGFHRQGEVVQLESAYISSALGATGSQTVTPANMDGIAPGCVIECANADGTNSEQIRVTATTSTTFTATFGSTKSANWTVRVVSMGWKPVMSGASTDTPGSWTYTLQEGSFHESNGRVQFNAAVTWTATGGTGQLQMTLPVTSANRTGYTACALSIFGAAGIVTGTAVANVQPNAANVVFSAINTGTGAVAQITSYATGTVYVSGSYEV